MRIAIGADHAGRHLKDVIGRHLVETDHEVEDLGTFGDDSVDYPDYAAAVGRALASGTAELGVCCCGTGIGVSIAANKIRGVRASLVYDATNARLARAHNDANVICFGGRTMGELTVLESLDVFLSTKFEGGRHERRVEKISTLEKEW